MGNQVCCKKNNQDLEFERRAQEQEALYNGKTASKIGFNPKNVKNISQQLSDFISTKKPFQKQFNQIQKKAVKINYNDGIYYGEVNQKKKPQGYGRLYLNNGSVIVSKFQNGQPFGQKYVFNSNRDYFHGISQGCLTDNSKGHYSCKQFDFYGSIKKGKFQGQGKLIQNHTIITGVFKEGKIAKGTLSWTQNNKLNQYQYDGQFNECLEMQGKGKLTDPNRVYEGFFLKNQKHGFGIYTYNNGSKFEGYYSHGKKQGFGKFFNQFDQLCYDGEWTDGFPTDELNQKVIIKMMSSQKQMSSLKHNIKKTKHKN